MSCVYKVKLNVQMLFSLEPNEIEKLRQKFICLNQSEMNQELCFIQPFNCRKFSTELKQKWKGSAYIWEESAVHEYGVPKVNLKWLQIISYK